MNFPEEPKSYLGIALVLGIAGFSIGGVVAAVKGTGPDAAMVASIATLLAALAGGLVGNEIARGKKDKSEDKEDKGEAI